MVQLREHRQRSGGHAPAPHRAGPCLDLLTLDGLLGCLARRPEGAISAAAALLDGDRRGRQFSNLALAVIHRTMSALSALPDDDVSRVEGYSDLSGVIQQCGLADTAADLGLARLLASAPFVVDAETLEYGEGDDILSLIEALAAFQREGYTLNWAARRLAQSRHAAWGDVQIFANQIMSEAAREARR